MSRYALDLSDAFGYLRSAEVDLLSRSVRRLKGSAIVVNLGAGTGTSSLTIVETRPDLADTLWTVDISEGGPLGGLQNEVNAFFPTGLKMPHQILGDSLTVGRLWKDKIDFLMIDDDHSSEHLHEEIDVWCRHVRSGGRVAFHDYGSVFWPGVQSEVDDFLKVPGVEVFEHQETLIVVDLMKTFKGW